MREFGDRPVERPVNLRLAKGVVQMVVAADHVRHAHVVVVDDDREVVGRGAVAAQDDQIVELGVGDRDLALDMVADRRDARLRRFQTDRRGDAGRCGCRIAVAPSAVIAHRALFGARLLAHRFELGGRAPAVIGAAGGEQLPRDFGMAPGRGRIDGRFRRPIRGRAIARPSMIAATACGVERTRSVSSMRSRNAPPWWRAKSQLNKAVRAPPICRNPVGEGAKRTVTVIPEGWGRARAISTHLFKARRRKSASRNAIRIEPFAAQRGALK